MSKRNYNKMSNPQPKKEPEEVQNGVESVVSAEEPKLEPVVVDEPKVEKPIIGIVDRCEQLNIRENPNIMNKVVCVINKGTEVVIDKVGSTKDFYKVELSSGVKGFCMKKYIVIHQ